MRENLFLRTDVLPEELPILFSNKNVYRNFSKQKIIDMLTIERENNKKSEELISYITVPYQFYIPKNDRSYRRMSLLHPIAQLQTFAYILRYDQLIVSFCKKSEFSVRSPIIRNQPVYNYTKSQQATWKRMDEEFSFSKDTVVTTEEDVIYFTSFFSYKQYKRIQQLYDSKKFNREKYKYQYFMKFDVQNFFPSIYTHALSWAIFGEKPLAKKLRTVSSAFGNATDVICQRINFNETNGIVVGPEFSRIMAELLMTRIDIKVQEALLEQKLVLKKDYILYRYMDDFFVFTHNKEDAYVIERIVESELDKYNLKMNLAKTQLQERPFEIVEPSIIELKNVFSLFEFNYNRHMEGETKNGKFDRRLDTIWIDLFNNVELIICKYPASRHRVVNYFLKKVRSLIINLITINKFNLANILEIVSNIYSLSIDTKSTNAVIAVYLKVIQELKKNMIEFSTEKIEEKFNFINEKVFQNLYMSLKNNFNKINQMYDVIIFIKTLEKNLSSTFLCKIIEQYKDSYFVMCTIGYYILNVGSYGVIKGYLTVQKKLRDAIFDKIENYSTKGSDNLLLEAEYFYFINDFSYYPGFSRKDCKKLRKIIDSELKKFKFNSYNPSVNTVENRARGIHKQIFNQIMSNSYYEWGKTTETFIRDIAKKITNVPKRDTLSDY